MVREYAEKRDFLRMAVRCEARYRVVGEEGMLPATVCDLSATGMLLEVSEALAPDTRLAVVVPPGRPGTDPLVSEVRVLRCDAVDDGYRVAVAIEHMV